MVRTDCLSARLIKIRITSEQNALRFLTLYVQMLCFFLSSLYAIQPCEFLSIYKYISIKIEFCQQT